ncbi:hypothetical protein P0082_04220 [Candidatus Haliotispira prima]|uniref:Uncharacterized protein n=1 Tax=Candidatus Haliotispira prima TaxID=3034016 RepID=A0ABY8MJD1_9SPIO|nr:hypothetical protein P0082_04220 [Candidatus Haliotispira prima]
MKKVVNLSLPYSLPIAVSVLLIMLWGGQSLFAQAPTDEWRRAGLDAMVAEPGQASSILSNPAGIKTKEERRGLLRRKDKPAQKHEWIAEIISAELYMTEDLWDLTMNPAAAGQKFLSRFDHLNSLTKLLAGQTADTKEATDLLRTLAQSSYDKLTNGTTGLPSDPTKITISDLRNLSSADRATLADNLRDVDGVLSALINSFSAHISDGFLGLGFQQYSRILSLAHVNDENPLAWGFYLGFEQKFILRTGKDVPALPLELKVNRFNVKTSIPISFQAYVASPIRLAFAHDFAEALPGFTFGIGLKAVPYIGMNEVALGREISRSINDRKLTFESSAIVDALGPSSGMNIGLDFGVQYHFGAIIPQLDFLHAGLKISDLIGFNVPFSADGDPIRYAIDFDWGVYGEFQIVKIFQVFGGFEVIQTRGMFEGGKSPYSALFEPIDHLRFLAGIALFDNVFRFTLGYYNRTFSPGVLLNLGAFQFHGAFEVNTLSAGSWGLELTFRFRGPHNGFNEKIPYKTYAQLAGGDGGKGAKGAAEVTEAGEDEGGTDSAESAVENTEPAGNEDGTDSAEPAAEKAETDGGEGGTDSAEATEGGEAAEDAVN